MDKIIWKKLDGVTPEYDGFVYRKKYKIIKVGKWYIIYLITVTGVDEYERVIPLLGRYPKLSDAKEAVQNKFDLSNLAKGL